MTQSSIQALHLRRAGQFLRDFARDRTAAVGLVMLIAVVLAAVFAPLIAPQDPYDLMTLDIMDGRLPPGSSSFSGQVYLLGTDTQGRDMLSAILYGLRISLLVGLGAAGLAFVIGTLAGLLAAYVGGRFETLIMRLVDLQLSFPTILAAMLILAFLGKGVTNVVLAIVIVEWAAYARTARGSALSVMRREYVEAARSLMIPPRNIILRHLLPNCMSPLIVLLTMQAARAIALEATLSFLGLGVPITEPSLGLLIANGFEFMLSGAYWISIYPGIALLITIYSINLVGDRLRRVLDPKATLR
ncbi:ABC transporter permease [Martelella sp. FOR1707]